MIVADGHQRLADRLGVTVHVSPLRIRLGHLMKQYPSSGARNLEDWLLDVANRRGARIVVRANAPEPSAFMAPPSNELSQEDLVVAICQPNGLDRPQLLRLAGQMISGGRIDIQRLIATAIRERAEPVLKELARQALKVDPHHPAWTALAAAFARTRPTRDAVLHWTRLAEAVPVGGRCNAASWRLVT